MPNSSTSRHRDTNNQLDLYVIFRYICYTMQQVTIGTKNQIVLPKEVRKKIKGLKPGNKVMVYPLSKDTVAIKVNEKSWLESSYGIAKDAWKDIDPIAELEKMRNEWDDKP